MILELQLWHVPSEWPLRGGSERPAHPPDAGVNREWSLFRPSVRQGTPLAAGALWHWRNAWAWAFGLVCLGTWGALHIEGVTGARHELARFAVVQAAAAQQTAAPDLSEEALVPAFIIEELEDGRFTVFVPSVPTPLAGAVYVLRRERVHILDIPFTQAVRSISRWGAGSSDFVAAMRES